MEAEIRNIYLNSIFISCVKVLLIDDSKNTTEMVSKYLTLKGHKCTVSNDGEKGLSLILEKKFDVILLDLAMPEFSGGDVISALEKNGKIKDKKIILFTSSGVTSTQLQALQKKGIHSVINKPVKMDELLRKIEYSQVL